MIVRWDFTDSTRLQRVGVVVAIAAAALATPAMLVTCRRDVEPSAAQAGPPAAQATPAAREAPVVRPQPGGGRLRIGVTSASTARACRPYDLQYRRPSYLRPSMSDLWWKLDDNDHLDVSVDRPFVARRLELDLYHWVVEDSPLCQGAIDVAINGGPARPVSVAAACQDGERRNRHVVTLDLDQPTPVTRLRLGARVAPHNPTSHYILVERVTLRDAPTAEPEVAKVVDVWAEVHETPPGIPGPGLWAVRPGLPPREIRGPLPTERGAGVDVWSILGSSQVFLAQIHSPPTNLREIYALDAATEDRPRLARRFDADIHDAWYDECADALAVELVDHSAVFVPVTR